MNRSYLRFLLQRDLKLYQKPALTILISLPVLELSLFGFRLNRAIDQLYIWVCTPEGKMEWVLSGDPAQPLPELLNGCGFLPLLTLSLVLLTLFMLPVFLSDTRDGNSLYTQMRLPFSRLHYYGERLLLPAAALLLCWLEQLVVSLFCRGLYLTLVPETALPAGADRSLRQSALFLQWYPLEHPAALAAALSMLLLLPAALTLIVLAARGRDGFCTAAAVIAAAGLLCFFAILPLSLNRFCCLVPVLATLLALWSGGYAIARRQTF
ncbi:MAG: hypothetical protein PUC47_03455 [Oscillospiraceae bacterium]|nr:hypothetical protein [Oscillospiraceae bacterium]